METSRAVVHQPVESACIVFNLEDFTLKNMVCESFYCFYFYFLFGVGWGDQGTQKIKIYRKGTGVTTIINLIFFFFRILISLNSY